MHLRREAAFTLVEIAISLGILAFCLVSIIGLLPTGLSSVRDAECQAAAARLLGQLSNALHGSALSATEYRLPPVGGIPEQKWKVGDPSFNASGVLNAFGFAETAADTALFAWRVEITPPTDTRPDSFGRAIVRIAWPQRAVWSGTSWNNASGQTSALILFRGQ